MSKRRKEAEVIVFEEPKFKKRKSEKELCRVSQIQWFVYKYEVPLPRGVRVQTCHSCSRASHHREETAPAASLSDSRLRSWTLRQRYEKSRNMVNRHQKFPFLHELSLFQRIIKLPCKKYC